MRGLQRQNLDFAFTAIFRVLKEHGGQKLKYKLVKDVYRLYIYIYIYIYIGGGLGRLLGDPKREKRRFAALGYGGFNN
jgi:hypothetical protein